MILDKEPITDEQLASLAEAVNADMNPVKYLAIDPGKANGVCGYDAKFHLVFMYTIREEDMVKFLEVFKRVETCITESFLLFPTKTKDQIYSDMETSRVIGRVEGWAARAKVKLVMQPSSIKKTGYAWIGKKPLPKSNPKNHKMDAHVHFMFWAVKNGKINAADLLRATI